MENLHILRFILGDIFLILKEAMMDKIGLNVKEVKKNKLMNYEKALYFYEVKSDCIYLKPIEEESNSSKVNHFND